MVEQSQPISIHPGETITLQLQDHRAVIVARGPAPPMSAFEAVMLRSVQSVQVPPGSGVQPAIPITRDEVDVAPPPAASERVQLTYRLVPGVPPGSVQHSFLVIRNGYPTSFRYRVAIHVKGRVTATDVCEVLPNVPGNEHWPYVIDQLDITAAWLEPTEPGSVRCE
jgi:hypothetical protein